MLDSLGCGPTMCSATAKTEVIVPHEWDHPYNMLSSAVGMSLVWAMGIMQHLNRVKWVWAIMGRLWMHTLGLNSRFLLVVGNWGRGSLSGYNFSSDACARH